MTEGKITVLSQAHETFGFNVPDYKRLIRLYCMNGGYHLQILPDGAVGGTRDENIYSVLRMKAVSPGVVLIEGIETGLYLSMNKDGELWGTSSPSDECYFLEKIEENHYNTYQSQKYNENWYVGIKKNGRPKHGPRTHVGQKAIFFLPRQVESVKE
ncbi:putative fibroblast growth factor 1 [Chanos chanos]|uniref:Fibroblast growth factor n=1 Tax=Chanos chanos TaxID=29144 RepID=A0A6J2UQS5_CHACN|nr:putative fibroblast growth factor 1 [Chanos chanos]